MSSISKAMMSQLFRPKSIALIGGSDRNPYSHLMNENLVGVKFAGSVFVVNKRGASAHGYPGVTSCKAIGEPVDAAILLVPVEATMEVVEDAAAAGIRNLVVISSGFDEVGNTGRARQKQLQEYCEQKRLNVLGPNCLGYRNYLDGVALGCIPYIGQRAQGSIALVSASGSVAFYAAQCGVQQGVGLTHLISTGNEMNLTTADIVDYLLDDARVKGFVLFLEAIRATERFAQVAERARLMQKPIVALKVGAQAATAAVAAAHTGALVGNDRVFDAACEKYAIVRVKSIEECIAVAGTIAATGAVDPPSIAAVSISGGICEVMSDLAVPNGVHMPAFTPDTQAALRTVVSSLGQTLNPIDLTGAAVREVSLWQSVSQIVSADPGIGLTVINLELPASDTPLMPDALEYMGAAVKSCSTPVLLMSNISLPVNEYGHAFLTKHGVGFAAPGVGLGMLALGRLMWWSQRVSRVADSSSSAPFATKASTNASARPLSERAVLDHLARSGVPVIPATVAQTAEQAVAAARALGAGVALKILSADIAHKTELGGVKLNIAGDAAVSAAYESILSSVRAGAPQARIEGVTVSPFRSGGVELLVGVSRDPQWGLVIAVGLGGVWVEALDDSAVRLLPVSKHEIVAALKGLRGARLFAGFRGAPAVDLDQVAEVVVAIGKAALALGPDLMTLEVNPLFVRGTQIEALDALAIWRDA
jgi:acetate---CoA ligase (ADP-forming)